MKICLASTSPRRRRLLEQLGVEFETVAIAIDECWDPQEPVSSYARRMALEKARAAKSKLAQSRPILAADTSVILDGDILGKALNEQDAVMMLRRLSGRTHKVYTAVALLGDRERTRLHLSRVSFCRLSEADIKCYCDSGEPIGKAGGYAVQGRAAAFIKHLEGSYSGVVGLPLYEVAELLKTLNRSGQRY